MIKLTRLNHTPLIVNSDLIEHIEVTPDTVITLTSGQKYMVLETTEEIIERVISFRQSLLRNQSFPSTPAPGPHPAANVRIGEPPSNG
jgi:flagellar protein FlbD